LANPTTNYGFVLPTPSDLVTDLPADFEVALQGVDTQMKTNADAAIAKSIVDAKGDIVAATAADTVSRLAVGANNTVLTADSSTATGLKWATPAAAASGLTKIVAGSFSGVAGVAINGCFTATYKKYLFIVDGLSSTTDPGEIYLQLQYSTSTVENSAYYACSDSRNENGTLTTLTSSNTTKWTLGKARAADSRHQFTATITNVGNSSQNGAFSCYGNLGNQGYNIAGGMVNSNRTYTGIYLSGQGNIGGTYTVYGLEN
jgi:hypothetical protein